jgi:hypothetical protein
MIGILLSYIFADCFLDPITKDGSFSSLINLIEPRTKLGSIDLKKCHFAEEPKFSLIY